MSRREQLIMLWDELKRSQLQLSDFLEVFEKYPELHEQAWKDYCNYSEPYPDKDWYVSTIFMIKIFRLVPDLRSRIIERFASESLNHNRLTELMLELAGEFPEFVIALAQKAWDCDGEKSMVLFFEKFPSLIDEFWPKLKARNPSDEFYGFICQHIPRLAVEAAEYLVKIQSRDYYALAQIIINVPDFSEPAWKLLIRDLHLDTFYNKRFDQILYLAIDVPEISDRALETLEAFGRTKHLGWIAQNCPDEQLVTKALKKLAGLEGGYAEFTEIITARYGLAASKERKMLVGKIALEVILNPKIAEILLFNIIRYLPELREQAWFMYPKQDYVSDFMGKIICLIPSLRCRAWEIFKYDRHLFEWYGHYLHGFLDYPEINDDVASYLLKRDCSPEILKSIIFHVPSARPQALQLLKDKNPHRSLLFNLTILVPEITKDLEEIFRPRCKVFQEMEQV